MRITILSIMIILFNQCTDKNVKQSYPEAIINADLIDIYTNIKWGFYKYYQDCSVDAVNLNIKIDDGSNYQSDYKKLYSKPLFYHEVDEVIIVKKESPNRYELVFFVEKGTKSLFFTHSDCFYDDMGSHLYGFSINRKTKKVDRIEYQEYRYIQDTIWINNVLYSPDEPFVEKLLAHQDSITPWLKNELILRGYLKE